jgi:hypothetical protein
VGAAEPPEEPVVVSVASTTTTTAGGFVSVTWTGLPDAVWHTGEQERPQ